MSQILVVDDEVGIRELLSEILREEGHDVQVAESASQARQQRSRAAPDLVLLDIWMPDSDGVTLLKEWAAKGQLTMPVVMMSGHGTIDTAVEATRIGAYAYLEKPIALQKLLSTVGSALARADSQPAPTPTLVTLGKSPAVTQLLAQLGRASKLSTPVLFLEASGGGADMCAPLLKRKDQPWIEIASPDQFDRVRNELVDVARDSVVYLRQVHSYSREQQYALMSIASELEPKGVRLLSSTSVSLPEHVSSGDFDARLYGLLAATVIRICPLRERAEDIPEIAEAMLARLTQPQGIARRFSPAAMTRLREYHWPGNLSQLQTVVSSSATLASAAEIGASDVVNAMAEIEQPTAYVDERLNLDRDLRAAREDFERVYIEYHLGREDGNMSRVASRAGLERTHLYRKIKQLGIKLPRRTED